jgi:hypothetical protein
VSPNHVLPEANFTGWRALLHTVIAKIDLQAIHDSTRRKSIDSLRHNSSLILRDLLLVIRIVENVLYFGMIHPGVHRQSFTLWNR